MEHFVIVVGMIAIALICTAIFYWVPALSSVVVVLWISKLCHVGDFIWDGKDFIYGIVLAIFFAILLDMCAWTNIRTKIKFS